MALLESYSSQWWEPSGSLEQSFGALLANATYVDSSSVKQELPAPALSYSNFRDPGILKELVEFTDDVSFTPLAAKGENCSLSGSR